MSLVKGEGQVFPKSGKSFDPAQIPQAIKDAGFSAAEIVVTADGTLAKRRKDFPELDVPSLSHPFVLAGGGQADALAKRSDLVGKKIHVTGKLHPSHGDLPPGLTVEGFEAGR